MRSPDDHDGHLIDGAKELLYSLDEEHCGLFNDGHVDDDEGAALLHMLCMTWIDLLREMVVWQRPGDRGVVYVSHCRASSRGCEGRARHLAGEMVRAGRAHGVDPWLLGAIALRESGLNPMAVGAAGETSIMQIHPRGRAGDRLARACSRAPSRCTSAAIWLAAEMLAGAMERCGSEAAALGAYNSGRCGAGDYSRRVLARRDRLALVEAQL